MALRTTPTIAICLTAGIAAGIALARPADREVASDATDNGASANATVTIEGFSFGVDGSAPAGSAVSITNVDTASHTLTSRDGLFETGRLGQGSEASIVAPDAPGTYEFFCAIHPSMTGSLIVGNESETDRDGTRSKDSPSDGDNGGY